MDEILLLEKVERYLKGEMTPEEKSVFDTLRKDDPEVDQLVVEHTYFMQGLERFGATRAFKHKLHEREKIATTNSVSNYFSNALTSCAVSAHCWRRTSTPPSNVQRCAKRAANVLPVALARPE